MEEKILDFDFPTNSLKIIKVIGVGGGGGNAVKHMFKEGIHDVTFVLCNTDVQALQKSGIPVKIQLGPKTANGLGAGNDPLVARAAAEESAEEIRRLFTDGTQMAFITAGMGGGTGTGAAPVVARIAKEQGILTVGIVTIPFLFEKTPKIIQALRGVEEMRKNVDALLVINNERLREIYADGRTTVKDSFAIADNILSTATKSIAEIITTEGSMNLDFRDVKKILKDGGVAIMSMGKAKGDKRLTHAIETALHSPLLNNNDIAKAKKILFNITASTANPVLVDEMDEINNFMESLKEKNIEVIWGLSDDDDLEEEIKFTVLATGFGKESIPGIAQQEETVREEVFRDEDGKKVDTDKMISEAYGDMRTKNLRTIYYYEYATDSLDNQDVIDLVDSIPTYQRLKSQLDEIRRLENLNAGTL